MISHGSINNNNDDDDDDDDDDDGDYLYCTISIKIIKSTLHFIMKYIINMPTRLGQLP